MRTTVSIDDGLLSRAKRRASSRGLTLGEYVEVALRRQLAEPEDRAAVMLPVFTRGSGLAPGLDPSSNSGFYDILDASNADA